MKWIRECSVAVCFAVQGAIGYSSVSREGSSLSVPTTYYNEERVPRAAVFRVSCSVSALARRDRPRTGCTVVIEDIVRHGSQPAPLWQRLSVRTAAVSGASPWGTAPAAGGRGSGFPLATQAQTSAVLMCTILLNTWYHTFTWPTSRSPLISSRCHHVTKSPPPALRPSCPPPLLPLTAPPVLRWSVMTCCCLFIMLSFICAVFPSRHRHVCSSSLPAWTCVDCALYIQLARSMIVSICFVCLFLFIVVSVCCVLFCFVVWLQLTN